MGVEDRNKEKMKRKWGKEEERGDVGFGNMTIPSLSSPLCPEAKPITPNSSGIPGAPFRAQGGSAAQGPRNRQGDHPPWVSGPPPQSSGSSVRTELVQIPAGATLGGLSEVGQGLAQLREQSCDHACLSGAAGSARLGATGFISQGSAPR